MHLHLHLKPGIGMGRSVFIRFHYTLGGWECYRLDICEWSQLKVLQIVHLESDILFSRFGFGPFLSNFKSTRDAFYFCI